MAAKKVETPTLGATVRFAGADASTGLFQLEVEMASAAKPWSLTKRYADFHFFHSKLPETTLRAVGAAFPSGGAGAATGALKDELAAWFKPLLELPMTPATRSLTLTFLHARMHHAAIGDAARKLQGGVLKTGYLTKLGGNKSGAAGNWKKRFMVLTDSLLYYEDEQSYLAGDKAKGEIKLESIYCPTPEESREFEFILHALPYDFQCRADSQTELQEWVDVFQKLPEL